MTPLPSLSDRLDALKEPSEKRSSYGDFKCGCSWDSGPFGVFCEKHDGEQLIWDGLKELCEASEQVISMGLPRCQFTERLEAAAGAVRRMIDEGVCPPT